MTLDLNYGNAVTGSQRFSRPDLEKRFLRTLKSSAGVKMFGLRRIGKSTLRLYATEQFDAEGRPYAFVDGQGLYSLADLLGRLSVAMPAEKNVVRQALAFLASGPVSTAVESISKGTQFEEAVLSSYWQLVSEAIRKALAIRGPKPVLVFDEFSLVIDNMIKRNPKDGRHDAERLLASMREWRGAGMTMLLTGSLGMVGLARTHNLNLEHLNDLQPFLIPELTEAEARSFIDEATSLPSRGRWTNEHTDEFLKQTGVFYPCFLVRGLLEVGVEEPAAPRAFENIFAERVRPDLHNDFYNQFDRRFKAYAQLPADEQKKRVVPALKEIMKAGKCANESIPCGESVSPIDLALTLSMLAEDGFIRFSENADGERSWKPASRLAKLWWSRSKLG